MIRSMNEKYNQRWWSHYNRQHISMINTHNRKSRNHHNQLHPSMTNQNGKQDYYSNKSNYRHYTSQEVK